MARFRYVGTMTKENGRVDVKVATGQNKVMLNFVDVEPNVTVMEVEDEHAIRYLDVAMGLMGEKLYERIG